MECFDGVWQDLVDLPAEPPRMREKCSFCERPVVVCWCKSLPKIPINTKNRVIILQHPAEEKRCLRTAEMLKRGLAPGRCSVYRGKKFPLSKHAGLLDILSSPDSIVVYPTKSAVDVSCLPKVSERGRGYNLILIDGTWPQAKGIYHNTEQLHRITQVKFSEGGGGSKYVIRSQPAEGCLSTLEAAARALSCLEEADYTDQLVAPLLALCDMQLEHGAVTHHSTQVKAQTKRIGRRLDRYLKQFNS